MIVRYLFWLIGVSSLILGILGNDLMASTNNIEIRKVIDLIKENKVKQYSLSQYHHLLEQKQQIYNNNLLELKHEALLMMLAIYKMSFLPIRFLIYQDNYHDMVLSYSIFLYYIDHLHKLLQQYKGEIQLINDNRQQIDKIDKDFKYVNYLLRKNIKQLKHYGVDTATLAKVTGSNKQLFERTQYLDLLMKKAFNNNLLPSEKLLNKDFEKNKGKMLFPNQGFLEHRYHEAKSPLYYNGVLMMMLPNSSVIAPAAGEIVFIGDFAPFENLIIIEHAPSYYTLIAGKYNVLVRNTQLVMPGDQLATTYDEASALYIEMRHNSDTLDPSKWMVKPTIKEQHNNQKTG